MNTTPGLAFPGDTTAAGITGTIDASKGRMGDAQNGVHVVTFANNASVRPTFAKYALVVVAYANHPPSAGSE